MEFYKIGNRLRIPFTAGGGGGTVCLFSRRLLTPLPPFLRPRVRRVRAGDGLGISRAGHKDEMRAGEVMSNLSPPAAMAPCQQPQRQGGGRGRPEPRAAPRALHLTKLRDIQRNDLRHSTGREESTSRHIVR